MYIMKFKLLSAVILTALSATAFSATEQTFSDGLKIKLNEKSTGSDLRMYKGKPVLAISSPDNSKISHNYFDEFNVGKEGMYIGNHKGANTIITEVVSHSPSLLKGNIDIIGKLGTLVIANPNGITTGSGFGVSNTKNLELATAAIVNSSDTARVETMKNSNDGKLIINDTNITGLDKVSLISNNISVEKSKIDVKELNVHLLASAEYETRLSGESVHEDTYDITDRRKKKATIISRGPSKLSIDNNSEMLADNININLLESEFRNNGYIGGRENLNIRSGKSHTGIYSRIDNGDIVHMKNYGTLTGKNLKIAAYDHGYMENYGKITSRALMSFDLNNGSTFVNYGDINNYGRYNNNETRITFDYGTFENNGKMRSNNIAITNHSNGKFLNKGSLDFMHSDLTDHKKYTKGSEEDQSFNFISPGKSPDNAHYTEADF